MAHYAFLDDDNVVIDVITGRDEDDLAEGIGSWEEYYGNRRGLRCLRTSYNTVGGEHAGTGEPFRKNYAGIGYTYDEDLDAFIPPQPFESWILDEDSCLWVAPVVMPATGGPYMWDEETGSWAAVE